MIDTVYQIVKTVVNKELRGNVTPAEFNLLSRQVQERIFRGYMEDANRDKIKHNRGMTSKNFASLPLYQRQRIEQFWASNTLTYNNSTSDFDLPVDLYFIKDRGISYNGAVVDEAEASDLTFLISSAAGPSEVFPVYERKKDSVRVIPSTITSEVVCRYLRTPAAPKWTYRIVSGVEMFDPSKSDYQDFELHESELSRIVILLLSYFGINIRETEVTQYAEALRRIMNAKEEEV
jgi:hypothetical protein